MPGQRKRRERELRRRADSWQGPWETVFETQDPEEWRAYLSRIRAEGRYPDESRLRYDVLCGRLASPTTYRLSVPAVAPPR
ncbi:hypothetical protein [Kitasatospora herbaricolor]|uniref:Uncharacterized protein n=1 Tax=Kitasatospora herbaricolor TaxID=68217 RepID=A0ABZ1WAS7_9ACTN|nr:hypothetical protein [Kitasatospora herbaricolor]